MRAVCGGQRWKQQPYHASALAPLISNYPSPLCSQLAALLAHPSSAGQPRGTEGEEGGASAPSPACAALRDELAHLLTTGGTSLPAFHGLVPVQLEAEAGEAPFEGGKGEGGLLRWQRWGRGLLGWQR